MKMTENSLKGLLLCFLFLLIIPLQAAWAANLPIAGGDMHSIALKGDMTVWTWGMNNSGQLGDGTDENRKTSVMVPGIANANAIAGNGNFTLVLRDNSVWAWGRNASGQLGDGTTQNRNAPVQVTGLDNVIAIACGENHAVALKNDNTVWAWGSNLFGQLGNGKNENSSIPVQVTGLDNVTAIACGENHTIALRDDRTVWTWGFNNNGQLGDGTTADKKTPTQVPGTDEFKGISAGGNFSLAIRNDGTVWSWGKNDEGQLGDGTTTERNTPVQVSNLGNISIVAGGKSHGIALRGDGTVWTWGRNNEGQLGDGTNDNRINRVKVPGFDTVSAIAAGGNHTIVLRGNGTIRTWGDNSQGQLGDGTSTNRNTPVQTKGLWGQDHVTISILPESHNFGMVEVNNSSLVQVFEITNAGTLSLETGAITKSGQGADEFVVQNDACSDKILGPSDKCSVEVIFSPASEGDKSAVIEIPSNDPNIPVLGLPLGGTGVRANISVWPKSHNFGLVEVGTSSTLKFEVSNAGITGLVIKSIVISGAGADQFVIQNDACTGKTLAMSDKCAIEAKFSPVSAEDRSAVIEIHSNDPLTPIQNILLSGTGVQPLISVLPDMHDFGLTEVGTDSSAQSFEITNTSLSAIVTESIKKSGNDTDEFIISNDACTGKIIGSSGKCSIEAFFSPGSKGPKSANIELSVSGSVTPVLIVLSGAGKQTSILSVCAYTCDHTTIQAAIDAGFEGDVVQIEPGTYNEKISTNGKEITLSVAAKETSDANGDGMIGLAEAIYALQVIADMKR